MHPTISLVAVLRSSIIPMGCSGCDWDPAKNRQNWRKHRIRFEDACCVFEDSLREDDEDDAEYGEERRIAIGRVGMDVLVVVYTERNGVERIISARRADPQEESRYYARFTNPGRM
jgi:uncharacterized DUF497 family protein